MDEFYQRKLFITKSFTFTEKGIDIDLKDSDGDFSLFIAFDKIGSRDDIRVFTRKRKVIFRIGLALTLLTLFRGVIAIGTDQRAFYSALATAVIVGVIFYSYYYFTTLKYYAIPLTNGKHFQVLYNSPSNDEVEAFIDEIFERQKNYFRTEYFDVDNGADYKSN